MPQVDSHSHGHPSWADLATTDQDAAKSFYGSLFGWTYQDNPMGEGVTYSMAQYKDQFVSAIYAQREEMGQSGMPPMWSAYVTVDDVDARAAAVAPAGGTLMGEPFDVFDSGRMALVQDPSGAMIAFWQPKAHIGAGLIGETGSMVWTELASTDASAAGQFYADVLGWEVNKAEMDIGMDYSMVKLNGADVAVGIYQITDDMPGMPSHWAVYWAVEDCDATVEQAKSMGASAMVEPTDIPPGRFAVLRDPQGASFAIIALAS